MLWVFLILSPAPLPFEALARLGINLVLLQLQNYSELKEMLNSLVPKVTTLNTCRC